MKSMTGYSGTPLARKIGIKDGHTVVFLGAPKGWGIDGVAPATRGTGDVVLAFFRSFADFSASAPKLASALPKTGMLWIAWPRKAGGHVSDMTENGLRDVLLPTGLVDVKVAALDEDWSGLKFVWRKELR